MKRGFLIFLFMTFRSSVIHAQENVKDSSATDQRVFTFVEKSAEFPGGLTEFYKFIGHNINYPKEARKKRIEGKVFISFVIEQDGSVDNIKIVKSANEHLDKEAIRIMGLSPKWIPGEQSGRKIRQLYTIPISFRLGR